MFYSGSSLVALLTVVYWEFNVIDHVRQLVFFVIQSYILSCFGCCGRDELCAIYIRPALKDVDTKDRTAPAAVIIPLRIHKC